MRRTCERDKSTSYKRTLMQTVKEDREEERGIMCENQKGKGAAKMCLGGVWQGR